MSNDVWNKTILMINIIHNERKFCLIIPIMHGCKLYSIQHGSRYFGDSQSIIQEINNKATEVI